MESLFANKPLLYSLLVSASAVLALASGLLPDVMTQFQLVEFDVDVRIYLSFLNNSETSADLNRIWCEIS